MAEIFLSQVGAAVGQAALPGGISAFGLAVSGAAIGRTVGSLIGAQIDNAIFGSSVEGPRAKNLYVGEAREGVSLPIVYGQARLAGTLIWASRFRESRSDRSLGGKGGPELSEYSYTISFAMALCEGQIRRVDRAWANGEVIALSRFNHRIYRGGEDQLPDPVMEAIEGAGAVPAYRGTAYVVFEDFPVSEFGNRIPQLSFEVTRALAGGDVPTLADVVTGVNVIPATGEFVYATEVVSQRFFPGIDRSVNANSADGRADFLVSLDQLEADLPNVSAASLTVGWFGTSVEAGACEIRPGVERADGVTVPWNWRAGGVVRGGAHLITQVDGRPIYGGTPDDRSVVQALREMVARGLSVTVTPFLLMDAAGLPWRGRIASAADGTPAAREDIEAFLGSAEPGDFNAAGDGWSVDYSGPEEWSYRRFILHMAHLAKLAGGVESFLIGSEMVGLTRVRDGDSAFPFVEGLVALAADVKAVLGPTVKVSYAADWTEYGSYVTGNGVSFPLDPLWASDNIDFVGVDWYPPMGDWRDGTEHLDGLDGWSGPEEAGYLARQIEGGEAYDWYYASDADRAAQVRTPITDGGHDEAWIYRQKDIRNWWGNAHHERPGGVRDSAPTAWEAGSKPVRFCEVGFPAVDRGTNQPNVFYDPKSSESALPHFSRGSRDDVIQRAALAVHADFWAEEAMVEGISVWAWDGRPWPDFPVRSDVWSDGANWVFGHWLNGRSALVTLGEAVGDLSAQGGVALVDEGLDMTVQGYVVEGPVSVREALAALQRAFGFTAVERESGIVLRAPVTAALLTIAADDLAEVDGAEGASWTTALVDKRPDGITLGFIDGERDYEPGVAEAGESYAERRRDVALSLPLVMMQARAEALGAHLLETLAVGIESGELRLTPGRMDVEAGDVVAVEGREGVWRVERAELSDGVSLSLTKVSAAVWPGSLSVDPPSLGAGAAGASAPDLIVLDLPDRAVPVVAVFADPWPGQVNVEAGVSADALSLRGVARRAAVTGVLTAALTPGPEGRWDEANVVHARFGLSALSSVDRIGVLNGANRLAVECEHGWEVIAFCEAEWISADEVELRGLLRGLRGSGGRVETGAETGARCVLIDAALVDAEMDTSEWGLERLWRAGGTTITATYGNEARRPWRPVHLKAVETGDGGLTLSWIATGADIPDSLDAPDPVRNVTYALRFVRENESLAREVVQAATSYDYTSVDRVADEALGVEIAEIGADGREGAVATLILPAA